MLDGPTLDRRVRDMFLNKFNISDVSPLYLNNRSVLRVRMGVDGGLSSMVTKYLSENNITSEVLDSFGDHEIVSINFEIVNFHHFRETKKRLSLMHSGVEMIVVYNIVSIFNRVGESEFFDKIENGA